MPVAAAVVGGSALGLIGSAVSSRAQSKAADRASQAQTEASEASIAEQRRQFDEVQKLLSPYVNAGTSSLTAQQNLLGINGASAQQSAYNAIENSPAMQAYTQQGENAILQNASATGGLRGGNTQGALAQYRPQLLNQLINQQYANLGGLTSLGQSSAAGVGNAGMQTANNISNSLNSIGAYQAGNALQSAQATSNLWSNIGNTAGNLAGAYAMYKGF